ncbi:MAG: Ig-like domain-containing protein, partial [Nanoarchaeota archaeon]|nr:Ig-like domain-containing protein [Nanoarchaeota archaeon]
MVKKRLVLIIFCLIVFSVMVSSIDDSEIAAQNCIYSLSIYSLTANDCNLDNVCPIRDANCKGTEDNVIALCNEIKNEYGVLNRDKLDECWRNLAEINSDLGRSKEGGPCEVENPTACDKAWAGKTMWDELVAAGLDGECKIKNEEMCQEAHKKREEAEKECYGGVSVYLSQFNQALNSLVECNKQVYESKAKSCYEIEAYNRVVEDNLKRGVSAKRKIADIVDQMKNKGFSFMYGGITNEITWAEYFDKEIIEREDKLNDVINESGAAQLEKEIRWFEEDKSWYEHEIIPIRNELVNLFSELRPLEEGFNVWAEVNPKWNYLWDNLNENMSAHDWTTLGLSGEIRWFYGFVQVRNLKIEELNTEIIKLKQTNPESDTIKEYEDWIVVIKKQIGIANQVIKLKEERAELEDKRNMLREEFVEQRKQEADAIMEDVKAIWAIKGTCQRIGETVENSGVEQEDLCTNGKQDSSEEGIDCGGSCMQKCSFNILIIPNSATLTADGKDSKEFVLTAASSGSPLKNEKLTVSFWFPFNSKLMSDYGRISPTSITTDGTGKASFTYYAPRAPDGAYLKNLNFEIRATGKSGAKTIIHLVDPKPRVFIKLDQRSMIEDNTQMNYADVTII